MAELYVHQACNTGKLSLLKELLAAGADPTEIDGLTGSIPLHWAARSCNLDCAEHMVLNKLNDVNFRNSQGNTPLHYAAISGSKKISKLLIEHGAELNPRNKVGMTPLHGAAGLGWDHVIEYLASLPPQDSCKDCANQKIDCAMHKLDVNAKDTNGRTALHYAGKRLSGSTYTLLLQLGADPTVADNDGRLPSSLAQAIGSYIPWATALLVAVLACAIYYAIRLDPELVDKASAWFE